MPPIFNKRQPACARINGQLLSRLQAKEIRRPDCFIIYSYHFCVWSYGRHLRSNRWRNETRNHHPQPHASRLAMPRLLDEQAAARSREAAHAVARQRTPTMNRMQNALQGRHRSRSMTKPAAWAIASAEFAHLQRRSATRRSGRRIRARQDQGCIEINDACSVDPARLRDQARLDHPRRHDLTKQLSIRCSTQGGDITIHACVSAMRCWCIKRAHGQATAAREP